MSGPLDGVRVVDFSVGLAAPWACGLMADHGADVVKVERPGTGATGRYGGTVSNGVGSVFQLANRGKRSIVIDLGSRDGAALALDLCAGADVVVQNFRPGVAERLGVGYADIRLRNEDVIFLALTGFGTSGPDSGLRVYDTVIQSRAGIAAGQGESGTPQLIGQAIADKVTGLTAALAVSAALVQRLNGGGGQRIDLSLFDAAATFFWLDSAGPDTFLDAPGGQLGGRVTDGYACYRFSDGWATICPVTPEETLAAYRAFGIEPPIVPAAHSPADHARNRKIMVDAMAAAFAGVTDQLTVAEGAERARAAGVPFGIVQSSSQVPNDPQAIAGELFIESVHPSAGRLRQPRTPARFSAHPDTVPTYAPALAQHTDNVLEELGLHPARIAELRRQGTVA
jgi:crotonobetainyl-CoA:carnitine CoA-transferase CaiB-like acyl-CoA transferase